MPLPVVADGRERQAVEPVLLRGQGEIGELEGGARIGFVHKRRGAVNAGVLGFERSLGILDAHGAAVAAVELERLVLDNGDIRGGLGELGIKEPAREPRRGVLPVLLVEVAGVLQGLLRRDVGGIVDIAALDIEVAVHHVLLLDAVGVILDARRDDSHTAGDERAQIAVGPYVAVGLAYGADAEHRGGVEKPRPPGGVGSQVFAVGELSDDATALRLAHEVDVHAADLVAVGAVRLDAGCGRGVDVERRRGGTVDIDRVGPLAAPVEQLGPDLEIVVVRYLAGEPDLHPAEDIRLRVEDVHAVGTLDPLAPAVALRGVVDRSGERGTLEPEAEAVDRLTAMWVADMSVRERFLLPPPSDHAALGEDGGVVLGEVVIDVGHIEPEDRPYRQVRFVLASQGPAGGPDSDIRVVRICVMPSADLRLVADLERVLVAMDRDLALDAGLDEVPLGILLDGPAPGACRGLDGYVCEGIRRDPVGVEAQAVGIRGDEVAGMVGLVRVVHHALLRPSELLMSQMSAWLFWTTPWSTTGAAWPLLFSVCVSFGPTMLARANVKVSTPSLV